MNVDSETAPFRKWILRWWSVLALFRYNLSISEKKESTKTKYLWSFSFQLHSARTAYGHRISNSTEPVANKFTPELSAAFYRTDSYVGEHFLNLQKGSPNHV